MISPAQAISRGQVWLRPFEEFRPWDQGYMGFPSEDIRDEFLRETEDGALVVIWINSRGDRDWRGAFRGLLRIGARPARATDHESPAGRRQRLSNDSAYLHAVPVIQAWEADPAHKALMKGIIEELWPDHTRSIGLRSRRMDRNHVLNILPRRIREVDVFGHPRTTPGAFQTVEKLFT